MKQLSFVLMLSIGMILCTGLRAETPDLNKNSKPITEMVSLDIESVVFVSTDVEVSNFILPESSIEVIRDYDNQETKHIYNQNATNVIVTHLDRSFRLPRDGISCR